MATNYLASRLTEFKEKGGSAENMTKERLDVQSQQSVKEDAPLCPECGAPMVKRNAKRGSNQGHAF